MRHYAPKEILKNGRGTGLYHFCCSSGDDIYPVGYCSPWKSCPVCNSNGHFPLASCNMCGGKGLIKVENPCPGHPTKAEACLHYRQYLLDQATYDGKQDDQSRCEICGEWTCRVAQIPGHIIWHTLCIEHCNRKGLSRVLRDVHESWAS